MRRSAQVGGWCGRMILCALGAALALPLGAWASASLATATADLQAGKADEAVALLSDVLRADPSNAEANNLLCRVEITLEQFDQAAGHCEKAVSLNSGNASYHLWLGRALGERASRASFLSAYSLAKRTRAEFETAVSLDPRNADALSDLCEFYREAPGAVGGGMELVLCCDLVVAAKSASFGFPEVKRGLMPDYGGEAGCRGCGAGARGARGDRGEKQGSDGRRTGI